MAAVCNLGFLKTATLWYAWHCAYFPCRRHLFGESESSYDDVSGDVSGLKPDVNVVIAGVLRVPVTVTLLLHTHTHTCTLNKACNSTEAVFLVASLWHTREDVASKSRENGACRTRMLRGSSRGCHDSRGCYAENGPVEFKLHYTRSL